MRVILTVLFPLCMMVASCSPGRAPATAGTPLQPADTKELVAGAVPQGWDMEEVEPSLPIMWKGNEPCRHFLVTNPAYSRGQENPFHDVWVCPANFWGSVFATPAESANSPARYTADREDAILFTLSDSNQWPTGARDLSRALAMQVPERDEEACADVMATIHKNVYIPEIVLLKCSGVTNNTIVLKLTSTTATFSEKEIYKLTDQIVFTTKKSTSGKKRILLYRTYNGVVDAMLSAYVTAY